MVTLATEDVKFEKSPIENINFDRGIDRSEEAILLTVYMVGLTVSVTFNRHEQDIGEHIDYFTDSLATVFWSCLS
jgi:hypothetical protein